MTFGEHWTSCAAALIKSVLALAIGFVIGAVSPIAGCVVEYVQTPLKEALTDYYQRHCDASEYLQILEQRAAARGRRCRRTSTRRSSDRRRRAGPRRAIHRPAGDCSRRWRASHPGTGRHSEAVRGDAARRRCAATTGMIPLWLYHDLDDDPRVRIVGLSVQEPLSVYMKAAFVLGAVIASPFVFYYLWKFVAAGLYPHEKQYVHMFLPFSLGLFLAGVALAFFVVFQVRAGVSVLVLRSMGIDPDPRISDWLSFVLILPLGFGISFQLPLVMLFLERIGIFTRGRLHEPLADRRAGDLRARDGAHAERRRTACC